MQLFIPIITDVLGCKYLKKHTYNYFVQYFYFNKSQYNQWA